MQRIGVFVCHCGTNIAATVDVKKVAEMALMEPGVVHAEDYQYMCSEAGQALIAKAIKENRIIIVFGCGGDRDATKRPIMGRIAAEYGDKIYVTSDNPRTEDPVQIVKDVEVGVKEALRDGTSYEVIVDRREAINHAIHDAKSGDIVIIAGKGHENYQILKNETIHFDDREEARKALKEI